MGGWFSSSSRDRVRFGVFLAAFVLALSIPVAAFAATASFSSVAPKKGSKSTATRPTITVIVSDPYGVKGAANYSMLVDGVKVKPSIAYTMSRYRKFRLTYVPAADLSVGLHTVKVSVKDQKKKSSAYSWSFTVLAPPVVEMPTTITATQCSACHVGYPTAHPMTQCESCHGDGAPLGEPGYTDGDQSAHSLGCTLETPCHGGGGAFPHVLGADCIECHNGQYEDIPRSHGELAPSVHDSTGTFCTQSACHASSLTTEHYKYVVDGVKLSCATCHSSVDPVVRAAVASGTTACPACHVFEDGLHPGVAEGHALPAISCTTAGCHDDADAAAVHNGRCNACHTPGMTPATTCTTCHKGHDHTATPLPETIVIGGVEFGSHACSECHAPLDLAPIHAAGGCATCHPAARATLTDWTGGCVQGGCHTTGSTAPKHGSLDAAHVLTAAPDCSAADCHAGGANVAAIHSTGGCKTCHAAGKTPTVVCATAGCHGSADAHPAAAPHPKMTAGHTTGLPTTCAKAGCHAVDLAVVHDAVGCAMCHGAGKTPKKTCSTTGCHPTVTGSNTHTKFTSAHQLAETPSCIATGCHAGGKDVRGIHSTCGDCHSAGKPELTLVCATAGCHGSSDAHPAADPHPEMDAGHSEGLSTDCVTAGCHVGDLVTFHASALGCPTCHAAGKTPTKVCTTSGCHIATITSTTLHKTFTPSHTAAATGCNSTGCHTTNVITLHQNIVSGPSCTACHGAGKPALTLDCATEACHPVTPPTHASHAVTLGSENITIVGASFGSHACSECHAPADLIGLHASKCASCHPGAAATATINGGCVQGTCHVSGTLKKHGNLDASHTLAAVPTCASALCHMGGTNVAALHRAEGCDTCHVPGKDTTRACATAGCHSATDAYPLTNAHPDMTAGHTTGLPVSCVTAGCHVSDLVDIHEDVNGCGTCHGSGQEPTKECATSGCHPAPISSTMLHPTYNTGHTTSGAGCTVAGCHPASVITIHGSGAGHPGCGACHGTGKPTLTLVCATAGCHPVTSAEHNNHVVALGSEAISFGGTDFGTHSCSECHAPADLMPLHERRCASCHPGAADTATFFGGCVQGACHPAGALAKHGTITTDHTLASAPSCIEADCHAGGTNVAAIHKAQGCQTCHEAGNTPTAVCATAGCHGPSDFNPVADPHPTMVQGHSYGLTTSCVRAGCHSGTLVTLHAAAQRCATCHGPGKTPSKTCTATGCHSTIKSAAQHPGYVSKHTLSTTPSCVAADCHTGGTNVTAIHTTGFCSECHADGKPPLTLACATAGCHSASDAHPSSDPHPKMTAGHTTGLPASCMMSGCHSGDLVSLHANAQRCATCHAPGKTASKQCESSGCHSDGGSPLHQSHPSSETSVAMRINNLNLGVHACTECHTSMDMQDVHGEDGTNNSCATCHPTAAGTVTTGFTKCATSNCHAGTSQNRMHANIDAAHTAPTQPSCTQSYLCHVGGTNVALTHFMPGCDSCHGEGKTPSIQCSDCHTQARTGDHTDDHAACNDCHAPYAWDYATSTPNKGGQLIPQHWSLQDNIWALEVGRAVIRPGYPYGDFTMLVWPGPIGGPGPYTSEPYAGKVGTYDCDTCHTGAGKVWQHPGYKYFTCGSGGDCHEHHYNWDPAQGSESYVHNTPPANWRITMKW